MKLEDVQIDFKPAKELPSVMLPGAAYPVPLDKSVRIDLITALNFATNSQDPFVVYPTMKLLAGVNDCGLYWTIVDQLPPGQNPLTAVLQFDWSNVDVQTAETMAFVTLSLCELFRAYTVRSERTSIFRLGVFSNKYMQYAVILSIVLTLSVVILPFLQPIFNTHMPTAAEWVVIFVLATLPAIAEEITKFFLRRQDTKAAA